MKQTTEETQVSLLSTAERIGMKRGIEQGREEGLKEAIADILEIKFGAAGLGLFGHVKQITDLEVLRKIRAGLKQAQSVAEAEALIRVHTSF
jgi:hypothetical protein